MNRRAFTLIEVLIYTAIFGMMVGFLVLTLYRTLDTQTSNQDRVTVDTEADFLMRKMLWGLDGATAINLPASGATGTTLSITRANFSGNPLVFDATSGVFHMSRAGNGAIPLTGSNVKITSLIFQHFAQAGNSPEGVSIRFGIAASSTNSSLLASTTLPTPIYLNK